MTTLQKRFLSAVAMIAVALLGTYLGGLVFVALILAVALLMSWEWLRMTGVAASVAADGVHYGTVVLAVALTAVGEPLAALLAAAVGAPAVFLTTRATPAARSGLAALGILYVSAPAIAMIWLRGAPSDGLAAILVLFVCVWATDTFAMVAGKMLGGPLVMPHISPKKTWSGVLGGLVAGSVATAMVLVLTSSAGGQLWWYGLVLGAALSVAAQLGDFGESAVKRMCRVKDTSGLIPGHGGVLDRMDGLVGAGIAAGLLALAIDAADPARALVTGG